MGLIQQPSRGFTLFGKYSSHFFWPRLLKLVRGGNWCLRSSQDLGLAKQSSHPPKEPSLLTRYNQGGRDLQTVVPTELAPAHTGAVLVSFVLDLPRNVSDPKEESRGCLVV